MLRPSVATSKSVLQKIIHKEREGWPDLTDSCYLFLNTKFLEREEKEEEEVSYIYKLLKFYNLQIEV